MNLIARFLHFYSGYTLESLMREKAIIFWGLLNDMFKIHSADMIEQSNIVSLPYVEKAQQRKEILAPYQEALRDIVEEFKRLDYDKYKESEDKLKTLM